jgi:hypothetical protein
MEWFDIQLSIFLHPQVRAALQLTVEDSSYFKRRISTVVHRIRRLNTLQWITEQLLAKRKLGFWNFTFVFRGRRPVVETLR